MLLLFLRKLYKESGIKERNTKIITQVLNSENQDLITDYNADDFIISNKMLTFLMSQLSEEPEIMHVYNEMFGAEGSEIYLKPASYYFANLPVEVGFADMYHAALKRKSDEDENTREICLGLRQAEHADDAGKNFGVIVNPDKKEKFTLTDKDYLVVFAENEL